LRLIGAEDRMISRAFERPFALRAAFGGACGAALALIFVEQMPRIEGVDTLIAGASGYGPTWWLAPLAPIVAGLTALIATRITAFVVLRRD
ncbi:MAG: hypothetical protein AAFU55_14265, partial [Pseudomonadota bacterium]